MEPRYVQFPHVAPETLLAAHPALEFRSLSSLHDATHTHTHTSLAFCVRTSIRIIYSTVHTFNLVCQLLEKNIWCARAIIQAELCIWNKLALAHLYKTQYH